MSYIETIEKMYSRKNYIIKIMSTEYKTEVQMNLPYIEYLTFKKLEELTIQEAKEAKDEYKPILIIEEN